MKYNIQELHFEYKNHFILYRSNRMIHIIQRFKILT